MLYLGLFLELEGLKYMSNTRFEAQGYSYPLNHKWSSHLDYLHNADLETQYRAFQQANVGHAQYRQLKSQLDAIVTSHKKMLNAVNLDHARDNSTYRNKYDKLKNADRLDYDSEHRKLQRDLDKVAKQELDKLNRKVSILAYDLDANDPTKNWLTFQKIANAYDSARTEMEITKINLQAKLDSHLYYLRAKELVRKSRRNDFSSDYYYYHHCAHRDYYNTWATIAFTSLAISALTRPSYAAPSISSSSMNGEDAGKALVAVAVFVILCFAIALPAYGMYKLWQKANQSKTTKEANIKKTSMVATAITSFIGALVGGAFLPWAGMAATIGFSSGGLIFFGILAAVAVGLAMGCLGYAIGAAIAKASDTSPRLKADNKENQTELDSMNKEFKQNVDAQSEVLKALYEKKPEIEKGNAQFRMWPSYNNVPSAPPLDEVLSASAAKNPNQQQEAPVPSAPPQREMLYG